MSAQRFVARIGLLRQHERLLMISVSTVMVMAGQGVVAPVLPLFAKNFGVGAAVVGLPVEDRLRVVRSLGHPGPRVSGTDASRTSPLTRSVVTCDSRANIGMPAHVPTRDRRE